MAAIDAYSELNDLLNQPVQQGSIPESPPSSAGNAANAANALLAGPQAAPEKQLQPFPWYSRAAYGLADPMVGLAQLGFHATPWSEGFDQLVANRQKSYEQQREAAGQSGFDVARFGGNVLSPVNFVPAARASALALRAPAWLGTPAEIAGLATGAFTGAAQPVTPSPDTSFASEKASQAGLGGLVGAAGGPIANAVTGAVSPTVAALQSAGVVPRPGQAGGVVARLVEGLEKKIPIVEGIVSGQQEHALQTFNTAFLNKGLAHVGETVDGKLPINEQFQDAAKKVSDYYTGLMPRLSYDPNLNGGQIVNDLVGIQQSLPQQMQAEFDRRAIQPLMSPIVGNDLKILDSKLAFDKSSFVNSNDPFHKELGYAIDDARDLLRNNLAQSNPGAAADLAKADKAFAVLKLAEAAGAKSGRFENSFTPAQILAAQATGPYRASNRQLAQGRGLMQSFAQQAENVIGSARGVGNRPARASDIILGDILGGGTAALGFGAAEAAQNEYGPDWLKWGATIGAPALMLTRPGQAVLRQFSPGASVRQGLGSATQSGLPLGAIWGALGGPSGYNR